jgi:hypothetical protein
MGQEDGPDVLGASANQADRSFQELDVAVPASVDQCEVGAVGDDGPVDVGAFEDEDVLGDRGLEACGSRSFRWFRARLRQTPMTRRTPTVEGVRSAGVCWLTTAFVHCRHSAAIEELRAEGITEPSLVLFIGPAAAHNQELPDGGMVKGPQDVGRPGDVQR